MLNFSDGFQKQIDLKNPNRLILAKMYYDDNTSFLAVSTMSIFLEGTLYHGIITRYSAPKMSWNWDGQNNVVVTSPTLELGNFESDVEDYSLVDEFYTKNFLGRKIELFIGFQGVSDSADLQKFYEGSIEDLVFSEGAIKVVFKSTDLPKDEIAGRRVDANTGKIGDDSHEWIPEDANGLRIPVVWGRTWNSPGVCVQYAVSGQDSDSKYLFTDWTVVSGWAYDAGDIISQWRNNSARTEELLYVEQDDYLVPIHTYNVETDGARNFLTTVNDATYKGCIATVYSGSSNYSEGGNITAGIPMHFTDDAYTSPAQGGSITSGDPSKLRDGNTSTYMQVGFHHTPSLRPQVFLYDDSDMLSWNIRSFVNGDGYYDVHSARPVHLGNRSETLDTYQHGRIIYASGTGVYDTIILRTYVKPRNSPNTHGQSPSVSFNPLAPGDDLERGAGTAGGSWSEAFNPSGIMVTADNVTYIDPLGNVPDVFMSSREAWEKYNIAVQFLSYSTLSSGDYYHNICDWFTLHSTVVPLPNNKMYSEVMGPRIASSNDMLSLPTGLSYYRLRRPYQFIEGILRSIGKVDNDFDTNSWEGIADIWDDVVGDRRDWSGFTITESTKFSDFLKDYLKYETFTVFKDDVGKYKIIMPKDSYTVSDVDAIIDYNQCSRYEMSLSKLSTVVTDIEELSVDYIHFKNEYVYKNSYKINDGSYSYQYYDFNNSETGGVFSKSAIENKYTSHSKGYCVKYGGNSYSCARPHLAEAGVNDPATSSTHWHPTSYNADDPSWTEGNYYTTESAEAYQIARRYLNQFGNRHRVIKLASKNMDFYKYQIGDVVSFENVPDTLLGMEVSGFAGSTASSATLNGQTVYPYFMVYSVQRDMDEVQLEAFQLHKLNDLTVTKGN